MIELPPEISHKLTPRERIVMERIAELVLWGELPSLTEERWSRYRGCGNVMIKKLQSIGWAKGRDFSKIAHLHPKVRSVIKAHRLEGSMEELRAQIRDGRISRYSFGCGPQTYAKLCEFAGVEPLTEEQMVTIGWFRYFDANPAMHPDGSGIDYELFCGKLVAAEVPPEEVRGKYAALPDHLKRGQNHEKL